jgi:hypothetical protein
VNTGKSANRLITFGATGDSFFEYLVKTWIQVACHAPAQQHDVVTAC